MKINLEKKLQLEPSVTARTCSSIKCKTFSIQAHHTLIKLFRSGQSCFDLCMLSQKQLSGIYGLN